MAALVASLGNSFRRVPPLAIPAMLDCILVSAELSPSSLFSLLMDDFPSLSKDVIRGIEKLESEECNYFVSFMAALCHLLKKSGAVACLLQSFVWKILIPLSKSAHSYDREILSQTACLFFDVVAEENCWGVLEATVAPFFLRLIGLSMGMSQSEELCIFGWSRDMVFQDFIEQPTNSEFPEDSNVHLSNSAMNNGSIPSQSASFPMSTSCHILCLTIASALQSKHVTGKCRKVFVGNLLWDLLNMTVQMLSQSLEHRSCATNILLPSILKGFVAYQSFEVSIHGKTYILSRKCVFSKIWESCTKLFSLGPLERRDAYAILSLYSSYFSLFDGCKDDVGGSKELSDLTVQRTLLDELRKGLVDKESLVRKQSLHILRAAVHVTEDSISYSGVSDTVSSDKSSVSGMTKRGRWAENEAKSLGVGQICNFVDLHLNIKQKWQAFFLLYEMLEEYGTHLVEAAWNHQMNLLLRSYFSCGNSVSSVNGEFTGYEKEKIEESFKWLAVLWERAFCHDNPQVRCLIMQSFLGIDWKNFGFCAKLVPEDFVLDPFVQGLNDPVHHKDFGVKGVYSSKTIEGSIKFLFQYSSSLNVRSQIIFLSKLASFAKKHSLGRAGLMGLAECIASAASGVRTHKKQIVECCEDSSPNMTEVEMGQKTCCHNDKADLLENLRFIIECSKQHFNPNYRHQVCERIFDAAASVMSALDVPLELLLHFIASFPREFTDCFGPLRDKLQTWLSVCYCCCARGQLLQGMCDFLENFISHHISIDQSVSFDDEDLDAWWFEAKRWSRVFFLVVSEEQHMNPILTFIQSHGTSLCKKDIQSEWVSVKFLVLILSLVEELQVMWERISECDKKTSFKTEPDVLGIEGLNSSTAFITFKKFSNEFVSILEELVLFTELSCSIFWSNMEMQNRVLPGSIKGRLGGPSQRRLPSSVTTAVLQAITSLKAVASISSRCSRFINHTSVNSAVIFLWKLSWRLIFSPSRNLEIEAEILLAAYEALSHTLKMQVPVFSSLTLDFLNDKLLSSKAETVPLLDYSVQTFLQNINNLIADGNLVRTRRAVLMDWKWICLESLLSIPNWAHKNGVLKENCSYFSDAIVRWIFGDLVDSLENAGEGSVLPMLRSVRLILELPVSGKMASTTSCCDVDAKMMWQLVHSSWVLHVSWNKRRVAPIAALMSSVLHYLVFNEVAMHETDGTSGPLKWFVEKILEEGTKSPRTVRLAALHLTGLWLDNPQTIKYYMKELKLLTLYGSVAFDEDFEAELTENPDARSEVLTLAKSPDPELTEEFINTELYARVSVAVLFSKLAELVDMKEYENSHAALEAGKMFLLELLESVVTEKDLSKELYKKYSAIHRRKIRVWQMICILTPYIDEDIVQKVTCNLHISLYKNNFPSVRQYLETFAIHIYLKYPSLVGEQLVPLLRNYDMRPQALSSYVFIAANVILHATEAVQLRHLDELLPPVIPLLTSHHHTLRGFTQLLVYQVLQKLLPALDSRITETISLEKRCFEDLKVYLEDNCDCRRLRASMEGYLDAFNPKDSITPAGIFTSRVEDMEFECVPTCLMERVIAFLNDAREDLRFSMAKNAATIKGESLKLDGDSKWAALLTGSKEEESIIQMPNDISLDFQKKITFSKHERQDTDASFFPGNRDAYRSLMDLEKEDQLLDQLLHSRSAAIEDLKANRQRIILVASLLDRIPNLAGLARTCEVFKAAGLAIADTNVLHDKQFQLISVTADKWVPIVEVPVSSMKFFLERKKQEGFSILGLEQTANSIPLDQYRFPKKTVLVLGREKEGIPTEIIHILDACIEIPQLGVVRSLNVHVSGAIALWEYTRQQRSL